MTLDVKFEEQDQTFNTDFGEVQTVSDGGFERGYNEGYAQGEVEGYDKGKTDGLVDGYDKGKTDGLVEGYDKGKTDGLVEGEQVGFDNAISKLTTLEVTENGEYTPSDDNIGFDKVTVNIGGEEKSKLAQIVDGTLTEVTANDLKGITKIRERAFYYSNIKSIEIPNTVTTLPKFVFSYSSLERIIIPDSVTYSSDYAFSSMEKLKSIELPDSITFMGSSSFYSNGGIESVKLPNKMTHMGEYFFYQCEKLASVTIPNGVTYIGNLAFYNCEKLTSITIPSKVETIRSSVFQIGTTTNKATITFLGTTPPTIATNSFNKNFLNKIIVPKGYGDVYKSATNWSAYADYIEEATE